MIIRSLPGAGGVFVAPARFFSILGTLVVALALASCGGEEGTDRPAKGGADAVATTEVEGTAEAAEAFGSEATGGQRADLVSAMRSYFGSISAGELEAACRRLARAYRAALAQSSAEAGQGGDCGDVARALEGRSPADRETARRSAAAEILRVGVEGDRAVVVYRPADGSPALLAFVREGGAWRATSLTGAPLP